MLLKRLTLIAPGFFLMLSITPPTSADAITSSGATDIRRHLSASEPRLTDPLSLTSAWEHLDLLGSPLLRHARRGGLAGSSLGTTEDGSPARGALGRPGLPDEALVVTPSGRLVPGEPYHDPEIASDSRSGHNVRIPEPASLTLVVAGLIGLFARNRMRRGVLARKVETRRVD